MVKAGYKRVELGPINIEIPNKWEQDKMKNLIKFKNGYAFSSKNYTQNGKIVFRMSNIDRKGNLNINNNNTKYCDKKTYKELESYHLKKDDLVICMTDMNSDLNILGRTGIIDESDKYILNQRVGRMRIKQENKIFYRYLHYYTNFKPYLDYIKATATGTAQYNTSTKTIKNTKVILPPLPEQKKIASILSSVDKAIEKTDQVIEKTKKLKKGLMQKLLTKGIGNSEFKEVRIGPRVIKIPRVWKVKMLDEFAKVKGGKRVPKNMNLVKEKTRYPYIRVADFDNYSVDTTDMKYATKDIYNKIKKYTISKEDVYISIAGTIGLVGVVPDKLDNQLLTENAAKIVIKNEDEIYNKFLAYSLSGFEPQSQINGYIGTTGVPKLALKRVKKLEIPIPPLKEQKKIASILSSVDKKIEKEKEYKEKLERLKKGLMQKLLTGEVRVKVEQEV